MNLTTAIKLGNTYRDKPTGFVGLAVSITFWYNQRGARVKLERGGGDREPQTAYFDEQRLVLVGETNE